MLREDRQREEQTMSDVGVESVVDSEKGPEKCGVITRLYEDAESLIVDHEDRVEAFVLSKQNGAVRHTRGPVGMIPRSNIAKFSVEQQGWASRICMHYPGAGGPRTFQVGLALDSAAAEAWVEKANEVLERTKSA